MNQEESDDSAIKKKKKDKDEKIDTYPIEITDRSGATHTFTSGSSGTAIFTGIADQYEDKPYATILETNFLADGYLTKEDLELYVELGYLKRITVTSGEVDAYVLTDKGRKALEWNREFKKKWHKREVEYR